MSTVSQPLVTCVMPTTSRRSGFVHQSIRYFLRQDYPNKELLIVDDPNEPLELQVEHHQIRRVTLPRNVALGAKRNFCVAQAHSDLIMHWDDDDWMAPHRISYQVDSLLRDNAEVCGLQRMLFFEPATSEVWLYEYPNGERPWLAGGSLLYSRDFWQRSPFPEIHVASDTRFIWEHQLTRRSVLVDHSFYVALIHSGNTSPKNHTGPYWRRWRGDLREVMGSDLDFYGSDINSRCEADMVASSIETHARADRSFISVPARDSPEYSIIMVAHNALEMTRLATLQTLKHSRAYGVQFVVVDNGSGDGTELWLRLLAQRGDIHLIRSELNLGHGPALELARKQTSSPYIVTLDSDAFPLADNWLIELRNRLNERVRVAGIRHHRDYIHPSCLMIARETLDSFGLSFLNEKDQPSQFDVAERLSVELKRRGFELGELERTGAIRRGSASEPVYLGSEYEGLVYHQWYTTRAVISEGRQVDDVPPVSIAESLKELFERFDNEPRDITVVMGVRAPVSEPERLRNAKVCLEALNQQTFPRERYRIVVVEQDREPRLKRELDPLVDKYVFAYNPGPYNRGWAFNIGARMRSAVRGLLCLIDADLLVDPDFLLCCFQTMSRRRPVVLPYREVAYLDEATTARAIAQWKTSPLKRLDPTQFQGRLFSTSQGGCLWIDADLYRRVGGHDERFRGWGREDREFCERLEKVARIERLPGRLLHLYHPRPAEEDVWALRNQTLYDELSHSSHSQPVTDIGNPDLYRNDAGKVITHDRSRLRDWENWHLWSSNRIEKIVKDEQRRSSSSSLRRRLAEIVSQMGDSLLDVGCGPGALWPHLGAYRPRLSWVGVDVTQEMLAIARRLFPQSGCLRGDAGCLPFASRAFDVVLLRHVLEHLPSWLMERALLEAMRVARGAVVVDFYVAPSAQSENLTTRVGENFLETRWAGDELVKPIDSNGWIVDARLSIGAESESDRIWVLTPRAGISQVASRETGALNSAKISIIMPTYRRGHTILRTVRMIQRQSYSNWELIVVDNSGEGDYEFADKRIMVCRYNERPSASSARNFGLSRASGDLVCFFDDDDDMFPNYLESFIQAFEKNPGAKMVRCGMVVSGGAINFSYATPECCLRREFATPNWLACGPAQDQVYFRHIVEKNGWSEAAGDIVVVREALCRANSDSVGGLRSGRY